MKHNARPQDIHEMDFDVISFVGERDGQKASPINSHATLIAIKGAAMAEQPEAKIGFLQRVGAAFKGLFTTEAHKGYFPDDEAEQYAKYPVADGLVKDDVDNDNDAADDYNAIYYALSQVGYDLSNATCISDDLARAESVKATIDAFLKSLDAFRASESAEKGTNDVPATEAITTPAAESAEKGEVEMTDAEKAALLAEFDTKIADAVKAAVEPLTEKTPEQAAKIVDAEKAANDAKEAAEKATADATKALADLEAAKAEVATANAAKKAAEDALSDATTKARGRKAAGGHDDGAIDNKDALKAQLKDNPNLRLADAVKTLMAGTPLNPAV